MNGDERHWDNICLSATWRKSMEVDRKLQELIEDQQTNCSNPRCRNQSRELADLLLETLNSPEVANLEYVGERRLNPTSTLTRPVYEIVHSDGRRLRLAFTGLSNIQIFSSRNKSTHCYPEDLRAKLEKFTRGGPA